MRLLLLIIIVYLVYRTVATWVRRNLQVPGQTEPPNRQIDDVMVKDPLCGVYFPQREGVELQHNGQRLYFCSHACRDRFTEDNP